MKRIRSLASTLCAAALFASAALGLDLDEARSQGLVQEQPSGYLAPAGAGASAEVSALIADVNAKRKKHYESIAKKNGIPVDAVAARAGAKLTGK